jgi:tetratricopeptide (TPR) repeat protein
VIGRLFLLLCLCLGVGAAHGQSAAASLYAEGNALYREGEFEQARQRYQEAVVSGAADARLYYNLGNASYKSGRLGEAVLWYERALRLAPRDEDVQANLRFLRRIKRDRDPESDSWLYDLYLWPTVNELCLATSLGLLGIFAVASWRLVRRPGLGLRITGALLVAWVAAAGTFTGLRLQRELTLREAVVVAEQGTARSGPEVDQTSVFVVHEGTKVVIERREGTWLLVRLSSGLGGWLPADVVRPI